MTNFNRKEDNKEYGYRIVSKSDDISIQLQIKKYYLVKMNNFRKFYMDHVKYKEKKY